METIEIISKELTPNEIGLNMYKKMDFFDMNHIRKKFMYSEILCYINYPYCYNLNSLNDYNNLDVSKLIKDIKILKKYSDNLNEEILKKNSDKYLELYLLNENIKELKKFCNYWIDDLKVVLTNL